MTMHSQIDRLRVERIESMAALEAMSGQLGALARAAGAHVFQHPAFFLPWCRNAVACGQKPACLALYEGDRLVGFLPLFLRRDRKAMMARVLMTPRYGSSPPFDLLLAGTDEGRALDLLVAEVRSLGWVEQRFPFDIEGTRIGSAWADRFAALGCTVTRMPGPDYLLFRCQDGIEGFRAAIQRKHRMNCERLDRRLDEAGRVDLVTGGAALEPALKAMAAIVGASWKGTKEMGDRGLVMLTDLCKSLAREGMLRLWLAHEGDRPIAYLLEIDDLRGGRHAFHNAQAGDSGRYSPGIVLLYRALMAAHEDKTEVYEFWGFRDYIVKFSNDARPTRAVTIANRGVLPMASRQMRALLEKGPAGLFARRKTAHVGGREK